MAYSEIVINRHYSGLNPVQFGEERCAPGHSFGPAVRTHWLLHYIVSGTGVFTREGREYRPGPGDLFVIPPYLETYYEACRENPWHYIWIGFTTDARLPEELDRPVVRCPEAGAVFEGMRRCSRMENGRSAFLSSRLWELIGVLLEQGRPEAGYVEKALNCMRSEYMTGITVQQIADRLNLDRSYFSTLFKAQTGLPPRAYLMNLRLEKAAALMMEYGERPSTAAVSAGYPDIYHFSKMFKRRYGVSPRIYYEQARRERAGALKNGLSGAEGVSAEGREES